MNDVIFVSILLIPFSEEDYVCVCPKSGPGFPKSYVVVFARGIVDHHSLYCLLILFSVC